MQTRLKELMAARSTQVYVLAHSAKIGARPFYAWADLPLPWTLVTNADAPPQQVQRMRERKIAVELLAV